MELFLNLFYLSFFCRQIDRVLTGFRFGLPPPTDKHLENSALDNKLFLWNERESQYTKIKSNKFGTEQFSNMLHVRKKNFMAK